jgi:NCS1 family nucleobase:cation symporter-1
VNAKAMIALVASILPVIPGFARAAITPGGVVASPTFFDHLYTYAWFVTFALSALIYLALMGRERGARSDKMAA